MWWVCMLPFLYAFCTGHGSGLFWFVSRERLLSTVLTAGLYQMVVALLSAALFLVPVSAFWRWHRTRERTIPLISLLLPITNGVWWVGSDYLDAWFWTAVLHSVQYLIIVTVRHADDRVGRLPAAGRLRLRILHGAAFYGFSLWVGFGLFLVAPAAYTLLGFDGLQAYVMMTMVINVHHFIVDGFIWRTAARPGAGTSRVQTLPAAA
jgi:hypothetical protein